VVRGRVPQAGGRREQGVVLGLTQSITSVSQIVAPVIAGSLIERGQLGALATAGVALRHDKKGEPVKAFKAWQSEAAPLVNRALET
jgi:hypothetical protein